MVDPAQALRDARRVRRGQGCPIAVSSLATLVVLLSTGLLVLGLLPVPASPVSDSSEGDALGGVSAAVLEDAMQFDDVLLADIAAYRGPRRTAASVAFALAVMVPLVMAFGLRDGRAVRTLGIARLLPGPALQSAAAAATVVVVSALARTPLSVWIGVVQDGRWGFRTRSVPGWWVDHLAAVSGRALAVGALVWLVATLVLRYPRDWPARIVLLAAVIGPLALLLHPLVVHPLLLPTTPMSDGPHRDAVIAVLERSDTVAPVLLGEASLRTTRRNAVATGLGPTERIVLHDTLLELEPHAVAAIAAHELAHLERRDPLRAALAPVPFIALMSLLVRRALRGREVPDLRALASAAAFMLALEAAATPLSAAVSRTIEHRTDVRSVAISQDPAAHLVMLRAFVVDGLADPDPPRWSVLLWASHPPPIERMLAVSGASGPATR
jgi:STE24 endopeptidase